MEDCDGWRPLYVQERQLAALPAPRCCCVGLCRAHVGCMVFEFDVLLTLNLVRGGQGFFVRQAGRQAGLLKLFAAAQLGRIRV